MVVLRIKRKADGNVSTYTPVGDTSKAMCDDISDYLHQHRADNNVGQTLDAFPVMESDVIRWLEGDTSDPFRIWDTMNYEFIVEVEDAEV